MKKLLFLLATMLIAVGISVAQTAPSGSNPDQGGTATTQSGTAGQTGAQTGTTGAGAQAGGTAGQQGATAGEQAGGQAGALPQTASPLPLLALLGLGSLGGGLISRFRK